MAWHLDRCKPMARHLDRCKPMKYDSLQTGGPNTRHQGLEKMFWGKSNMANLLEQLLEAYANSCSRSVLMRSETSAQRRYTLLDLLRGGGQNFSSVISRGCNFLPVNIKGQDNCFLYIKAFVWPVSLGLRWVRHRNKEKLVTLGFYWNSSWNRAYTCRNRIQQSHFDSVGY